MKKAILVTGPARSGKSEWAERLAHQSGLQVVYIATAQVDPDDQEWQDRIRQHQERRPAAWHTEPVPIDLPNTLQKAPAGTCLLVDSLGTWLANVLDYDQETWSKTVHQLADSLSQTPASVIFVSEETGWGIVPAYPTGRLFRDRLGALTQQIAATCDAVYLVTAGYALDLKTLGIAINHSPD
jgi:adenosylcobinamide kinase / adenosylcobinamide-phosphate guanylyltransferase